MAGNYEQLKDIFNNPTEHNLPSWDNDQNQISGLNIKSYFLSIINSLTVGFQFKGVATIETEAGTPDQNVFYLAGAGTYNNFGSTPIVIPTGSIGIIKWDGTWGCVPIQVGGGSYELPIATARTLGGVKIGQGINIDTDGTISVNGGSPDLSTVHLPKIPAYEEVNVYDFPKYNGVSLHDNGVPGWYASHTQNSYSVVSCRIIPLFEGYTYNLIFANPGGYSVLTSDAAPVPGGDAAYATGYDRQINTSSNQEVTLQGGAGKYLYVRCDDVSNGRRIPKITRIPNCVDIVDKDSLTFENTNLNGVPTPNRVRATIHLSSAQKNNFAGIRVTIKDSSSVIGAAYFNSVDNTYNTDDFTTWYSSKIINCPTIDQTVESIMLFLKYEDNTDILPATAKEAIEKIEILTNVTMVEPIVGRSNSKEISIFFIGNSLTQDAVSYVPWLLKNLTPNLRYRIYMWYDGGATLGDIYSKFQSGTAANIFSIADNNEKWQNLSSSNGYGQNINNILANHKFDIVCLQEYFNYKESYSDTTDFDNVVNYIRTHYDKNPLRFVTLFHAPKRDRADDIFNLTKTGVQLILKNTLADSLIGPGIAVYRALSTALDSLGDQGHLSPDGTHTQEGLPCLLQAYVVYIWILRQLAIPTSFVSNRLDILSAYRQLNIPGPNLGNGPIKGSQSDNEIAEEVATNAVKESLSIELNAFNAIGV